MRGRLGADRDRRDSARGVSGFPALFASAPLLGRRVHGVPARRADRDRRVRRADGRARETSRCSRSAFRYRGSSARSPPASRSITSAFAPRSALFARGSAESRSRCSRIGASSFPRGHRDVGHGAPRRRARAAAPSDAAPGVCGERAALDGMGPALDLRADLRREDRLVGLSRSGSSFRRSPRRPLPSGSSMGAIARRLTEHQVLTGALFLAGAVYLVYPLLDERARTPRAVVHARASGSEAASRWCCRCCTRTRRPGASARQRRRAAVARQHDVGRRAACARAPSARRSE